MKLLTIGCGSVVTLVICLLSLVLYVGYSVAIAVGTALSEAIAAVGTLVLFCFAAFVAFCFFLMMLFCNSPVEYALLFLWFIDLIVEFIRLVAG
jgi:hypothetical protein